MINLNLDKYKLTEIYIILFSWVLFLILFAYLKVGFNDDCIFINLFSSEKVSKKTIYLFAIIYGLIVGFLFSLMHLYVYPKIIHNASFGRNIIARSILFLICFKTAETILRFSYTGVETLISSYENQNETLKSLFIYSAVINFLTDFFLLMRKNMGPQYFYNLIRGKYHRPQEENRIFMFLDLSSSTVIAEKIGHIAYSSLLQDCFKELSSLLLEHNASIYQYVGDEAVITWEINKHTKRNQCISLFFAFRERLQNKKPYFLKTYDAVPFFRASVHEGSVIMSTVGEIKTEIVYHGDVLNTAARIQSICKNYHSDLLISEKFFKNINDNKLYKFKCFNNVELIGKDEKMKIYDVRE